jgi:hypothetical protein
MHHISVEAFVVFCIDIVIWSLYPISGFVKRCGGVDLPAKNRVGREPILHPLRPGCDRRRENHGKAKSQARDSEKAKGKGKRAKGPAGRAGVRCGGHETHAACAAA